jgi:hypothetical protein
MMEPKAPKDLSLRLLEVEQRFESYCLLHEEELTEIKKILLELREDILKSSRDLDPVLSGQGAHPVPADNGGAQTSVSRTVCDDLSV